MAEGQIYYFLMSLATLILLGAGVLTINARITDLNTAVHRRMDDLRADTFARFERLEGQNTRLQEQYTRLETVLVGKLAEVESRLARIEAHLDLR